MNKSIQTLAFAVLFMTACHQGADHNHENDSSASKQIDHIDQESLTLYTRDLELFMEYNPLLAGETSEFIIHLTDLYNDYSPIDTAEVSVVLEIDKEFKQEYPCVFIEPGIFKSEVTPPFSGDGILIIDVQKGKLKDQFKINHLHIFRELTDVHTHRATSGQVYYSKEQAWTTAFNVQPILPSEFSKVINASGEILAMPGEKQNLIAKLNGIVTFSTRNLVQGSPVSKGELLFIISGKGFAEDNISVKYQEAKVQFEKSKNQYLRHKKLVEERIVSGSQFQESRSRYVADSVIYFNLKKNVSGDGMKVFAPSDGYIHELLVSEGQFASTGSLLATISGNRIMLLRADVSQQYFGYLDEINDATFRPAYSEKVYTIEELNGKLLSKASSVAENNHFMPVYFEVINDGTLLEGAFAEFYLKTNLTSDNLVVPVSALIEEQNNFYVYVQVDGESYRKTQIKAGFSDGIYTEVLSGITPGERVVTSGTMLLKAASVTTAPVHSHTH